MLAIARRILVARAAAAIFSMASNIIALRMLPGDEYAKGAVAIAGAAIALPIFFNRSQSTCSLPGGGRALVAFFGASSPYRLRLLF